MLGKQVIDPMVSYSILNTHISSRIDFLFGLTTKAQTQYQDIISVFDSLWDNFNPEPE